MTQTQTPNADPQTPTQTPTSDKAPDGTPKFKAIDARARSADDEKLACFKEAVHTINEYSAAYVDAQTRKLLPGTLATMKALMPSLNYSVLSTAWTAFCLDPVAFSACTAQNGFRDIVKAHKAKNAPTAPTATENLLQTALSHAQEAITEAVSVGISPATLADLIKVAYAGLAKQTPTAPTAPAPAPTVPQTPAQTAPAPTAPTGQ